MKKYSLALVALSISSCFAAPPSKVSVDLQKTYQTIEGFGSSVVSWKEYARPMYYEPEMVDYAANELGQSVFRLQMWGGISPVEIEDWRDISYEDFQWEGEGLRGKVNVDWAKAMVTERPEVRVIGAVWSAPHWMKANGSRTGTKSGYLFAKNRDYDHDNVLRKDRYKHFAKWVVEWARYMESQGTPFYAISLQNELVFTQWFESTLYTPENYAEIVRVTGEMFESEGVKKPLFFGPEDMSHATYDDEERHRPFIDGLMSPEVRPYFDVIATHGYADGVVADSKRKTVEYWNSIKHLDMPYWITEGGTGGHEWPEPLLTGMAARLHVALAESNVSLFCSWQLTDKGRTTHNIMEMREPTKKTFATMQYWKHIRPGYKRVEASIANESEEDLLVSSYLSPDSKTVVSVFLNTSDAKRKVLVDLSGLTANPSLEWKAFGTSESLDHENLAVKAKRKATAQISLPAQSVVTAIATISE